MRPAELARDLAALLQLGFSAPDALARAARRQGADSAALGRAEAACRAGSSLAQALAQQKLLPPFCAPVLDHTDRATPEGFRRVADALGRSERRRRELTTTLVYPLLLATVWLVVSWFVVAIEGTVLRQQFDRSFLKVPLPTEMLMALAPVLRPPLAILAGLVLWGGLVSFLLRGGALLRIPLLGGWLLRTEALTWLEWLELFLSCGLSAPAACRAAGPACGPHFQQRAEEAACAAERGSRLSQAMAGALPELGRWTLEQAEEHEMRAEVVAAGMRAMQREEHTQSVFTLIVLEVGTLVLLGGSVMFALVAYILPLYQLVGNLN